MRFATDLPARNLCRNAIQAQAAADAARTLLQFCVCERSNSSPNTTSPLRPENSNLWCRLSERDCNHFTSPSEVWDMKLWCRFVRAGATTHATQPLRRFCGRSEPQRRRHSWGRRDQPAPALLQPPNGRVGRDHQPCAADPRCCHCSSRRGVRQQRAVAPLRQESMRQPGAERSRRRRRRSYTHGRRFRWQQAGEGVPLLCNTDSR